MKKLLSLICILVLIVGCGTKESSQLYKKSVCPSTNDIDNNNPVNIYLFDEENYNSADIYDETQITELVNLFKAIEIGDKVDSIETPTISLNISYENDIDSFVFYGDVVELYDKDGNVNYYKLINYEGFMNYANELIAENEQSIPEDSLVILDSNDIVISQNSVQLQEDDISLEIYAVNNLPRDIVLTIDANVDGYDIFGYQQLGVYANNEIGYYYSIPTSILKTYGIDEIGKLEYVVNVFEMEEDHDAGDFICKSEPATYELGVASSAQVNNDSIVYNDNGIELSNQFVEASSNTNAYLYIKNNNATNIEFEIDDVIVNGVVNDYSDFFEMVIKANDDMFVLLPIYNYNYNSETNEVTKYDIETLSLDVEINDIETTIVIK
ncbi:MAG: hypothetical protein Q4E33_01770 [Erysipelotrichaceae bacterium]|nr:hypothetical protein [Erysipelotrichaceae bacterium]